MSSYPLMLMSIIATPVAQRLFFTPARSVMSSNLKCPLL